MKKFWIIFVAMLLLVMVFATPVGASSEDGKYAICHVNARHNGQSYFNYLEVGSLGGHFYYGNPAWPKHGGWFGNVFRWDFVTVFGDYNCDGQVDRIPGCTNEGAWNYNPEATHDDGSCVYDVCPNLEGLQEEVPTGYVKPGRRCLPSPELPPVCEDESAINFGGPLPCEFEPPLPPPPAPKCIVNWYELVGQTYNCYLPRNWKTDKQNVLPSRYDGTDYMQNECNKLYTCQDGWTTGEFIWTGKVNFKCNLRCLTCK